MGRPRPQSYFPRMPPISTLPVIPPDPRDPAFWVDPYPHYIQMRAAAAGVDWPQLGYRCFARHDHVNALLRDRRFGRQILHTCTRAELGWPEPEAHLAPWLAFEAHSLLELEPPAHTRLRAMVNPPFIPRRIARLAPAIAAYAHELIDGFEHQREGDLLALFAQHVPVLVIAGFLGVPRALAPQLLAWSHDMVAIYQVKRDRGDEDRAVAATLAFSASVRGLIDERRASPGEDVISELLAARDANGAPMSTDELVTTAILLLNAGHEATVHAMGNGVAAFLGALDNPAARFAADPKGHVEEMLRFDPPLHLFTRWALEDVEFAGRRYARGERIGLLLGAANRDPARFSEPDTFDATRSPNPHVAFGAGLHACVGAPLARLEMVTAIGVLFARLPHLRLAGDVSVRDSWHFRGLDALPAAW